MVEPAERHRYEVPAPEFRYRSPPVVDRALGPFPEGGKGGTKRVDDGSHPSEQICVGLTPLMTATLCYFFATFPRIIRVDCYFLV